MNVAYYRVSTDHQGESGLGLHAQRTAVTRFLGAAPDHEFTEIESGKDARRPELHRAIAKVKEVGGRLVVAKLDRLARNVHFVSTLMEAGVEFVAVDIPTANKMTIHILAAVAEAEAEAIAVRTRAALEAAKERGAQLGARNPNNFAALRTAKRWSPEVSQRLFEQRHGQIAPWAKCLRDKGATFQEIADVLNQNGHRTPRGKEFKPTTVKRIVEKV